MTFAHPVADQPMMDLNTTPLIDVMLVLLVMFIITIPIQTHAVKLNLPKTCIGCPIVENIKNEVAIGRDGTLSWNRTTVSEEQLNFLLAATHRKQPEPELHLRPEAEARYEIVDRVLADIKRSGVTRFGFVGNEAYAVR